MASWAQKEASMMKTNNRDPETLLDTQRAWEEWAKAKGVGGRKPIEPSSKTNLADWFGSVDHDFIRGLIVQVMNATSVEPNKIDATAFHFVHAVLKRYKPSDELEAMQVVQMTAIHEEFMRCVGRLARAKNLLEVDSFERAVNKLARTYTMQMEAIKRHRRSSDRKTTGQQASLADSERSMPESRQRAQKRLVGDTVTLADIRQSKGPSLNAKRGRTPATGKRRPEDDEERSAA
jgi:hypothetical protein